MIDAGNVLGNQGVDGLTPRSNAAIISALKEADIQAKQQTRYITAIQFIVVALLVVIARAFGATPQFATAVLIGGGVSILNSAILAWRMSRASERAAHDAQLQLRLLYFYAAERFLLVATLLGLILTMAELPLAVLSGFVLGQAVLLVARLLLKIGKKVA
ncbi:MAG: hypothetical protein Fur0040_05600 [Sideroxydans sp.]